MTETEGRIAPVSALIDERQVQGLYAGVLERWEVAAHGRQRRSGPLLLLRIALPCTHQLYHKVRHGDDRPC